jgi:hypothetical protein
MMNRRRGLGAWDSGLVTAKAATTVEDQEIGIRASSRVSERVSASDAWGGLKAATNGKAVETAWA